MKKSKQRGRKQFRRCHFFEQAGRKRSQTKRGHGINHNLSISMEAATRFELVNSGFAVYLNNFYGFSPCYLILFLSLYYQCVIMLLIVSCFIVFYPVVGCYGSKMVATK